MISHGPSGWFISLFLFLLLFVSSWVYSFHRARDYDYEDYEAYQFTDISVLDSVLFPGTSNDQVSFVLYKIVSISKALIDFHSRGPMFLQEDKWRWLPCVKQHIITIVWILIWQQDLDLIWFVMWWEKQLYLHSWMMTQASTLQFISTMTQETFLLEIATSDDCQLQFSHPRQTLETGREFDLFERWVFRNIS